MGGYALYAAVFLAALGESTALVGLLVPGVGIVLGASAVAARGGGSLTGVALAASAGSILGFGLSYHLGRAGSARIGRWSQRARTTVEKARAALDRYGGWAIFWGHFFGPVRACVALVAGAGGFPPRRFWLASISGALAWGLGLSATGAALSGGWRLVEAALGRGSLLMGALLAVLYAVLRLTAGALTLGLRLLPRTSSAILDLLVRYDETPALRRLAPAHPRLLAWVRRRLSPNHATGLLLSAGALACAAVAWIFFGVVRGLLFRDPLAAVDLKVLSLLGTLRSEPGDLLFRILSCFGNGAVLLAAAAAGMLALLALSRRFDAWLLLLGFGTGEALMWGLDHAAARLPPPSQSLSFHPLPAFPSNPAFSVVALFGFLAYLGGRGLASASARARLFTWTGVAIVSMGVGGLYLGAQWPSEIAAGWILGGIWLSALVTAAEAKKRFGNPVPPKSPWVVAGCGLAVGAVIAGSWGAVVLRDLPPGFTSGPPAAQSHRPVPASELPGELGLLGNSEVEDLGGDALGGVAFFVVGDEDRLRGAAEEARWTATAGLNTASVLQRWADAHRGDVRAAATVYPLFWNGQPQRVAFALPSQNGGRWVIRCWETGLRVDGGETVWAVWIRNELPPERFLGLPVPNAQARELPPRGLFSSALVSSGRFRRVEGGPHALELLVPADYGAL